MELRVLMIAVRLLDPRGLGRRLKLLAGGVALLVAWWVRAVQVAAGRTERRAARRSARRLRIAALLARREREFAARAATRIEDDA